MVKCQKNVAGVKSCCVFFEPANLRQVEEELTAWAILKDKEQLAIALKCIVHFYDEWVFNVLKNSSFGHGVFNLITSYNFSLL